MHSFSIRARYARQTEQRIWDTASGKWITRKLSKPRLVERPPQPLKEPQQHFVSEYVSLIAEHIKLEAKLRREAIHTERLGPVDFIYLHYKLLEQEGFAHIADQPAIQQLSKYAWDLVDRYQRGDIKWDRFEDEIERWYILVSDKVEAHKRLTSSRKVA